MFLLVLFLFLFLGFITAEASETQGTIDSAQKYAWGENVGWINFGCDGCDVEITDTLLTGYAWSAQYGWLNLSPTNGGVENDGEGTLSGHAWASNLGWIDFAGVTINSSGEFLGYATVDSDASQISFNCANNLSCAGADFKVVTDWRPASSRVSASPATTSGSSAFNSAAQNILPGLYAPLFPAISPVALVPTPGLAANALQAIADLVASFFRPSVALSPIQIPTEAPLALRGNWQVVPSQEVNNFVFAPLPYELRLLAQQFPELDRTFKEVGVERFSDISKLAGIDLAIPRLNNILNDTLKNLDPAELADLGQIEGVKLNIPGMSAGEGNFSTDIGMGKIALVEGLPVAKFSLEAKKNLPSEFVFARGVGELVDLNVALSVAESGKVTQRMATLPGKTLKLVVKPLGAADSVVGYVVFKSATPKVTTSSVLRSSLSASALLSMQGLVEEEIDLASIEKQLVLSTFEYEDLDHDGIYTADMVTPVAPGEYEIITIISYEDSELGNRKMSMVTVIDPEGYVFEKNNGRETRIPSAVVSLYRLNASTTTYQLWNASEYQQANPQLTDLRGTYSFLVPPGIYYLEVVAPGYETFQGKAFTVAAGDGIHQNIELETSGSILAGLDGQTGLLIVVLLLLVYNLYRDVLRDRLVKLFKKHGK